MSNQIKILNCCISYYSYIKPQQCSSDAFKFCVVYHTIPTSNHNWVLIKALSSLVVYHTIPTSNHNSCEMWCPVCQLYIILFLHQTTTRIHSTCLFFSCISYYSYIKPQPAIESLSCFSVVYHTIPTSNHNWRKPRHISPRLYIILFLHQTTTTACCGLFFLSCISYYSYIKPQQRSSDAFKFCCCISYYSYIKPQLVCGLGMRFDVVYHTIPTSNHNWRLICRCMMMLYIILFLHQTTT